MAFRDEPVCQRWSLSSRNMGDRIAQPLALSFDRATKDLRIQIVGQNRAEEVNFQPASSSGGENYGWRRMEGLQCYPQDPACSREGLTMPILEYGRSLGQSVTGGFVYRGSRYPVLRGFYLYGDFGSGIFGPYSRKGPAGIIAFYKGRAARFRHLERMDPASYTSPITKAKFT